jgi:hypothetical protein
MRTVNPLLADLPSAAIQEMQRLLESFETALRQGQRPALAAYAAQLPAKVTIPKGAQAIDKASGRTAGCAPTDGAAVPSELFVDVHIATPYGVTSHLLIPACHAGAPAAVAWQTPRLTISYTLDKLGVHLAPTNPIDPTALALGLGGVAVDQNATVTLTFTVQGSKGTVSIPVLVPSGSIDKHTLTIKDALLTDLVNKIVGNATALYGDSTQPSDTSIQTYLLVQSAGNIVFNGKVDKALTLSWKNVTPPAPKPATPPASTSAQPRRAAEAESTDLVEDLRWEAEAPQGRRLGAGAAVSLLSGKRP